MFHDMQIATPVNPGLAWPSTGVGQQLRIFIVAISNDTMATTNLLGKICDKQHAVTWKPQPIDT